MQTLSNVWVNEGVTGHSLHSKVISIYINIFIYIYIYTNIK